MNTIAQTQLLKSIRIWILVFIVFLALSGITAFPLETELSFLNDNKSALPQFCQKWIEKVFLAVAATNASYPFLSYGTDWLAFAHIVIATVFIGPYKDPVRNIWVIQFGMIACLMVLPLAFIAGSIRGIPFYWQLIDCSFGVLGILPLRLVYNKIKKMENSTVHPQQGRGF